MFLTYSGKPLNEYLEEKDEMKIILDIQRFLSLKNLSFSIQYE